MKFLKDVLKEYDKQYDSYEFYLYKDECHFFHRDHLKYCKEQIDAYVEVIDYKLMDIDSFYQDICTPEEANERKEIDALLNNKKFLVIIVSDTVCSRVKFLGKYFHSKEDFERILKIAKKIDKYDTCNDLIGILKFATNFEHDYISYVADAVYRYTHEIRELRENLGISRYTLSRRLNIPERTISNWENCINLPPEYMFELIVGKIKKCYEREFIIRSCYMDSKNPLIEDMLRKHDYNYESTLCDIEYSDNPDIYPLREYAIASRTPGEETIHVINLINILDRILGKMHSVVADNGLITIGNKHFTLQINSGLTDFDFLASRCVGIAVVESNSFNTDMLDYQTTIEGENINIYEIYLNNNKEIVETLNGKYSIYTGYGFVVFEKNNYNE